MTPVFVIGSGRSGTTVLFNQLVTVLEAGTVSALGGRYPNLLTVGAIANRLGLQTSVFRPSSESVTLLERFGLSPARTRNLGRPLNASDISDGEAEAFRSALLRISNVTNRELVLVKNTGNIARVAAIAHAFPEAHFVYLTRDPRAVVSSLLKVSFWSTMNLWWCSQTPGERMARGEFPEVTAATHWCKQVDAAEVGFEQVPGHLLHRVSYEEFVSEPGVSLSTIRNQLKKTTSGTLDSNGVLSSRVEGWRSTLSAVQIERIEATVGNRLQDYGYKSYSAAT